MNNPYQPAVLQLLDTAQADAARAGTPEEKEAVAVQALSALIDGLARMALIFPAVECDDLAAEVTAACASHRAGFENAMSAARGARPH